MLGKPRIAPLASLVFGLFLLVGCAVPVYDEVTDKSTIALQKKIDEQFFTWASLLRQQTRGNLNPENKNKIAADLSYIKNAPFYAQTYADLAALQTRMASAETESTSQKAIDGWFNYIRNVIMNTEEEHQAGMLLANVLTEQRTKEIDGTFRSISTYILVTKPTASKK